VRAYAHDVFPSVRLRRVIRSRLSERGIKTTQTLSSGDASGREDPLCSRLSERAASGGREQTA